MGWAVAQRIHVLKLLKSLLAAHVPVQQLSQCATILQTSQVNQWFVKLSRRQTLSLVVATLR